MLGRVINRGEATMTTEEKKAHILAAAASFGAHSDLYRKECKELEAEGRIVLISTFTAVGKRVWRWKLAAITRPICARPLRNGLIV